MATRHRATITLLGVKDAMALIGALGGMGLPEKSIGEDFWRNEPISREETPSAAEQIFAGAFFVGAGVLGWYFWWLIDGLECC